MAMSVERLANVIADEVEKFTEAYGDDDEQVVSIETFQERGLMTRDKGIVICFSDGSEFHVTIDQIRHAVDRYNVNNDEDAV